MILVLIAQLAMADIPPPPDYVESCTVANHGEGCQSCSAYHGGREACEALEAEGYVRRCKTRGASVWSEVMCPGGPADGPDAPAPPVDPPPPTEPTPPPSPPAQKEPEPKEPAPTSQPVQPTDASSKCSSLSPAAASLPLLLVGLLGLRRRRG